MAENRQELNRNLAQMLKGGVIMDVTTPEQAKIAEAAGACAVMALERIPADIRAAGGVSRMSDPKMIKGIQEAVSIPVMAKCRIGHFAEAQILHSLVKGMKAYVGIYNLRILRKSGRISGGAAFVGDALGLRPIAVVFDGSVDVMCKVRGDKAVANKLADLAAKDAVDKEHQTVRIMYGDVPEAQIQTLEDKLREKGFRDVERSPLGIMVTSNTGPNALGVIFRGAPRA